MEDYIIGFIFLLSALTCIIICFFYFMLLRRERKKEETVFNNSPKIRKLLELNDSISFRRIQTNYYYHQSCNSKRQLENFSMHDYFLTILEMHESLYRQVFNDIHTNRLIYHKYLCKVRSIGEVVTEEYCQSVGLTMANFLMYEASLFEKNIISNPPINIKICCEATYTSPQGRNHYSKETNYNYDDLKIYLEKMIQMKATRQARQCQIKNERAKMTESLRYDIFKRDNFRCQICGSTAQDGVKLHVDHIIPVSKGGRTEISNLRTLCDRCNFGKSDKI